MSLWVVPPPPQAETAAWYAQHEPVILECLGTSFPGPHDSCKTIDLKLFDRYVLPVAQHAATIAKNNNNDVVNFRVADLGSGQGGVSVHIAKRLQNFFEVEHKLTANQINWRVTGVTLTDGAVADSNKVAKESGVEGHCEFVVGDYHKLNADTFPAASFDVVVAFNSICHAENIETVLANNALPLLKPTHSLLLIKDFYAVPAEVMLHHGLPPSVDYDNHIRTHAKNFQMGIFDQQKLTNFFVSHVEKLPAQQQEGEKDTRKAQAVFMELGEDTFDGKKFAASVFKGKDPWVFSSFGEVILKGFPPHPSSLMLAPFDEGIWAVEL